MSRGSDVEEGNGEEPQLSEPSEAGDLGVDEVERGLAEYADAIGDLIERAPANEREALHDYAVSLVREKLPAAQSVAPARSDADAESAKRAGGTAGVHLIGYGLLLLPVAFLMMLVFAPLGTILLFAGVALSVAGLVGGLLGRLRAT